MQVNERPDVSAEVPDGAADSPHEGWDYGLDVWQRSILFWDTLRQRADNMLDHERAGLPPLLDFKYETILDARRFDDPANYALLRITEAGDDCWDDCVDPAKPPVVVVDPRAGHGPGIGGFKHESEVGMALHEGHPVYFVIFFPEPEPGQTLADDHPLIERERELIGQITQAMAKGREARDIAYRRAFGLLFGGPGVSGGGDSPSAQSELAQ